MPTTTRRWPTKGSRLRDAMRTIAPAVPHARVPPSHIYSMVGLWEELIASNASSLEIQPDYYHAADFSVYAHLQLTQDAKARAMIDKSLAIPDRGDRPITFANFTARGGDAGPLHARKGRLGRRGCPTHGAEPVSAGGFAHPICPWPRHGAQRRHRRRQTGDRGDQSPAHRSGKGQPVVLSG